MLKSNDREPKRMCPGWGLNPHSRLSGNRILSPACLPVPPPGHAGGDIERGGNRARNGIRTRDPNLGKVVLYR